MATKKSDEPINKEAIEARLLRKKVAGVIWANDKMEGLKFPDGTILRFKDGKVDK